MSSAASWLVAASAAVILALGSIHLLYTFRGRQLHPRDLAVMQAMSQSHLVLTRHPAGRRDVRRRLAAGLAGFLRVFE